MAIPITLIVCLLVLLGILGLVVWRFWQSAQAIESQLREELASLEKASQRIENKLRTELQETIEAFQSTLLEKAELETQCLSLKQQCSRLRTDLGQKAQQAQQDSQAIAFEKIQTLLVQYPTLRCMAALKPDLPARNVVATLTALDNIVQFWGYAPIGVPWETQAYDPQIHQGDVDDLQVDETVYVRFVGYREIKSDRILIPAKVSRTLPGGLVA
jgi:hypothetical protein